MRRLFFLPLLLITVFLRAQTKDQQELIEKYFLKLPVFEHYSKLLAVIDSSTNFIADSITQGNGIVFHLAKGISTAPFPDSAYVVYSSSRREYRDETTHEVYDTALLISVGCWFRKNEKGLALRDEVYRMFNKDLEHLCPVHKEVKGAKKLAATRYFNQSGDTTPFLTVYKGIDPRYDVYYLNVLLNLRAHYDTKFIYPIHIY